MKQTRFLLAVIIVLACLTACAKKEEASTDVSFTTSTAPAPPAGATATAPATTQASAPADAAALIARSSSGSDAVSIALNAGPRVEIVSSGATTTLTGESKDTGKRKYFDPSGTQLVEVKPSDSGFKVRTPNGALLWKVKISEDKIKVSDNEENQNAWSIKTGYPDKAKVLDPSETEIGEVRFANDPSPARVRTAAGVDAWTIQEGRGSGAWGVLLIDAVPVNERAIILAELLSRGR